MEIQANASHSGEGYKDYLLNLKKCQVRKKIWQVIWTSSRSAYEAFGFKSVDILSFYYYSLLIIGRWNLNSVVCDFVSNCLEPWGSVIWGERQFSLVGLEWGCLIQGSPPINQRWRQLEEIQWLDDRTRKRGIVSSSLFSEYFEENTVPLERLNLWFVLYLKQDTRSWWSYPKDQRACFWQIPRGIIWVTLLKDVLFLRLVTNTLSLPS